MINLIIRIDNSEAQESKQVNEEFLFSEIKEAIENLITYYKHHNPKADIQTSINLRQYLEITENK